MQILCAFCTIGFIRIFECLSLTALEMFPEPFISLKNLLTLLSNIIPALCLCFPEQQTKQNKMKVLYIIHPLLQPTVPPPQTQERIQAMTASASAASHSKTTGNSFLRAIKSGDTAFCLCSLENVYKRREECCLPACLPERGMFLTFTRAVLEKRRIVRSIK